MYVQQIYDVVKKQLGSRFIIKLSEITYKLSVVPSKFVVKNPEHAV